MTKAKFGMGCFWGPDDLYSKTKGVKKATVGYAGGKQENPTYERLGDHTETVEVDYDPKKVSYDELLEKFWENHDPTYDTKRQYRSVIFYENEDQKKKAQKSLKKMEKKLGRKILTSIEPAKNFFKAEEYHQDYFKKLRGEG
jgi:methionine-S-sulfoxide reductase